MASTQYILIACGLVLMMMVHGGNSIKCFQCNSHTDKGCEDKQPPEKYSLDCSDKKAGTKNAFCRKTIQIIEFSVNNYTRTIRSCGYEEGNYKDKCYQRSGFGGRQEVCACSTDDCNGATTIKATFGVLLAAIVVFFARA